MGAEAAAQDSMSNYISKQMTCLEIERKAKKTLAFLTGGRYQTLLALLTTAPESECRKTEREPEHFARIVPVRTNKGEGLSASFTERRGLSHNGCLAE